MTKIFISYRRKDWAHTKQLADDLRQKLDAEIFVDFTGMDEADFEPSILRNLSESDVVLILVTERTFAPDRIHRDKDWVRREIREALSLDKKMILVCVDGLFPPDDIPDDIKAIQGKEGIRFFAEYFEGGVQRLVNFITRIEPSMQLHASSSSQPALQPAKGQRTLDEAETLIKDEKYAEAVILLEELRDSGYKSKFVNLDTIIEETKSQRDDRLRHQEAEREYREIATLVRMATTPRLVTQAHEAWERFYKTSSDYDPDGLEVQMKTKLPTSRVLLKSDTSRQIAKLLSQVEKAENAGNWDQVIETGEKILALDGNHEIAPEKTAHGYRNRGAMTHNEKQDYDSAIADYNRAIELDPNNADYFYQRSIVYDLMGKYNEQRRDLERAAARGHELATEKLKRSGRRDRF